EAAHDRHQWRRPDADERRRPLPRPAARAHGGDQRADLRVPDRPHERPRAARRPAPRGRGADDPARSPARERRARVQPPRSADRRSRGEHLPQRAPGLPGPLREAAGAAAGPRMSGRGAPERAARAFPGRSASGKLGRLGRTPGLLGAAGTAAALAMLVLPAAAAADSPFINGVTAGEITQDSAIIWGQTAREMNVRSEVATDPGFVNVVDRKTLRAKAKADDTFQDLVKHLDPGRTYYYRFCAGGACSDVGRFETAPAPDQNATIRFAWSGDETGVSAPGQSSPFWGQMKAFASMAAEGNDFNIDFGDTIYSDPEVPGVQSAITVPEKWAMYRAKLALPNQRLIREATGLYNHWDDHEFINDFSIPENGRQL